MTACRGRSCCIVAAIALLLAVGGVIYGVWAEYRTGHPAAVLADLSAMQMACRDYINEGRSPVPLSPSATCAVEFDTGLFTEYVAVLDENYHFFARGTISPLGFAPSSNSFEMWLVRDGDVSVTPIDTVTVSW